jgi:AtzE family amidohydrolase
VTGASVVDIAADVRGGRRGAVSLAREALEKISAGNGRVCAVTRVLADRALTAAGRIDAAVAAGRDPGPLAGVPFGVKDLFDVAGEVTTAGSALLRSAAPARRDARAIEQLCDAGAVLVATLNMDEFAYGFVTVNAAYGATRNPHDLARLAGGSSGGSAAAVAAGMLPFTLGSDTNGSIRVPAALCGLYGLKPTHGGLSMRGVYPFVDSFDDIGPFASSVADLRALYEVLLGAKVQSGGADGLRVARLAGYFEQDVDPGLIQAIAGICDHLGGAPAVTLPRADLARSAAFLMTAAEGGARHLGALRRDPLGFDPAVRDRLIAGALLPASAYLDAQRFQTEFRAEAEAVFADYDILIAPTTSQAAPLVSDPVLELGGRRLPARSHLGLLTQPLSFIGLPTIAAPLLRPGRLPLGLQLVAAPGREAPLFDLAQALEDAGLIGVSAPPPTAEAFKP